MTHTAAPPALPPGLGELLDQVAERQRLDFGHMASDLKADGSLITACDRWSDETLVRGLAALFPQEGVLSEEGEKRVPSTEAYWVVDPLDGTTNFIHGFPQYAVSIGLQHRGQITQAVVYDPTRDELFTASKGGGAYLNNRRIRVAGRIKMADTLMATGCPSTVLAEVSLTTLAAVRALPRSISNSVPTALSSVGT